MLSAIRAHKDSGSPALRVGLYVPTRAEVASWPAHRLLNTLEDWLYESPSELIPSDAQIGQVLAVLQARHDADDLSASIELCYQFLRE